MDGYYQSQSTMPYYHGAARQRGRGLGSLAIAVGRTAIPLFKKFVLPAAKRLGKTAIEVGAPELLEIVAGNTKPREAIKRVAKQTVRKQLGGGKRVKKRIIKKRKVTRVSRKKRQVDLFKNLQ